MKNLKRFLSGALATVMIAAAFVTGAYAKSYDDVSSTDRYAEQIEILSDIGVVKGTSENEFSPDEKVTREQMALLLFRLMIGKDNAGTLNTTAFTDLYDHTYSGAISWANASGYIIGTSATTFAPTAGISLQDAMTMLVRALGHSSIQMNGGYPWTYIDAAVKLGLDNSIEDLSYTKELTRAEVAAILYNALTAEYLIPRTASNGMTFYESTTIIERVFGYEIDESIIVATNSYALEGVDTVTKDGFVSVHTADGFITVRFADLGLKGTPDQHLGKSFRLVYKRDAQSKLTHVLGCTETGKSEAASVIKFGRDNAYVEIGGVKYQVVETLSDTLSTNANELLVYSFANGDKLTQITTNEALAALTGAFDAELIFDDKASDVADRLIIKPFAFGKYTVSGGKVNIAGGLKQDDLTVTNPYKAESGDYVLFYFNEGKKALEIAAVLPVTEAGKVTRLSNDSVTIGGITYKLGNEKLGISAESLHDRLTVGESIRAVVFGDQVLALEAAGVSIGAASKYLIAESGTTPVFENGKFCYVIKAIIDGKSETIFTENRTVNAGEVYRYTVSDDGIYKLIAKTVTGGSIVTGDAEFVQSNSKNDEIAFVIDSANGTTIDKSAANYTISEGSADAVTSTGADESSVRFITDANTVIIVVTDGTVKVHKGVYTSTLTVNDGASVTAIFDNEIGAVETLRFMFISDGAIGGAVTTETSVKVLASTGKELVDGVAYNTYLAFDFATAKVSEMHSASASLVPGTNYLTDADGFITATEANVASGIVTGFAGSTVTIGDTTFTIADGVKPVVLDAEHEVSETTVSETLMQRVEFLTVDGKITAMVVIGEASFEAAHDGGVITVSAADELGSTGTFTVASLTKSGTEIDISGADTALTVGAGFGFTVTLGEALEAGDYIITFTVHGVEFECEFTVA